MDDDKDSRLAIATSWPDGPAANDSPAFALSCVVQAIEPCEKTGEPFPGDTMNRVSALSESFPRRAHDAFSFPVR